MRRYVFFLLLSCFFIVPVFIVPETSYGFDLKGYQPVQPEGVFSTFSAETHAEGTAALGLDLEQSVDPSFNRFTSTFTYAFTDNIEFGLTAPYRFSTSNEYGFEDISLGFKHRVLDEDNYFLAASYLLSASIPSGKDSITTDGRMGGGLILSKKLGPFRTHLNLLYFRPDKETLQDEYDAAVGADLSVSHGIDILAELVFKKSHFTRELDLVEGRIGYRYKPTDYFYTTFGVGTDMYHGNPNFRIFITATFLYPGNKTKIKHIEEGY
jgi:hypothetical protein